MGELVRVRTIGQCVIEVGSQQITPSAERLFACALVLTAHPGVSLPREQLARLVWPAGDPESVQQTLRQALYRLRSLGLPLEEVREGALRVPPECLAPTAATAFTVERYRTELAGLPAGRFCWLPGYQPDGPAMSRWVEEQRLVVHGGIRRVLHHALEAHVADANWREVEPLTRHLLAIDPLNEAAVEALACALAMQGAKVEAMGLLERFAKEAEHTAQWLGTSARRLRQRLRAVRERLGPYGRPPAPIVGRERLRQELHRLVQGLRHSQTAQVVLLSAARGMGRTRHLEDLALAGAVARARVVRIALGGSSLTYLPRELAHRLLASPGVLGTSPQSLDVVRSMAARAGAAATQTLSSVEGDAITEACWAVAEETPLLVLVDDADRSPIPVLEAIVAAIGRVHGPILLVIAGLPGIVREVKVPAGVPLVRERLPPLTHTDVATLFAEVAGRKPAFTPPSELVEYITHATGGIPHYCLSAYEQWYSTGSVSNAVAAAHASITARIAALVPADRSALYALALTRPSPTVDMSSTRMATEVLASVPRLLDEGLLYAGEDSKSLLAIAPVLASAAASATSDSIVYSRARYLLRRMGNIGDAHHPIHRTDRRATARSLDEQRSAYLVSYARTLTSDGYCDLAIEVLSDLARRAPTQAIRALAVGAMARPLLLAGAPGEAAEHAAEFLSDATAASSQNAVKAMVDALFVDGMVGQRPLSGIVSSLISVAENPSVHAVVRTHAACHSIRFAEGIPDRQIPERAARVLRELGRTRAGSRNAVHEGLMMYEALYGDPQRSTLLAARIDPSSEPTPRTAQLLGNAAQVFHCSGQTKRATDILCLLASDSAWRRANPITSATSACRLIELAIYGDTQEHVAPALDTLALAARTFSGTRRGETFQLTVAQGFLLAGETSRCVSWMAQHELPPADPSDLIREGFRLAVQMKLSLAQELLPREEHIGRALFILERLTPILRRDYLAATTVCALEAVGRKEEAHRLRTSYIDESFARGRQPSQHFLQLVEKSYQL